MSILGAVTHADRLVMVLDFESIVESIMPTPTEIDCDNVGRLANARLAIADDSNFILETVKRFLTKGDYENINSFHNGLEVLDFLKKKPQEC